MTGALAVLALLGGMGALAGLLLAWADRRYPADRHAIVDAIDALLPQTQCAQCGYPGCRPYAQAVAAGAPIDLCPPGGPETVAALARLLGRAPGTPPTPEPAPIARIDPARCIGCARCLPACPVDAIIGAQGFLHSIVAEDCTGCELCLPPCPVDCIELLPRPVQQDPRPVRILARPRQRDPEAATSACIRCGLCVPACPEDLLPQELLWHARSETLDDAVARGLDDCIECGLCNQACPANIDLLTVFTTARQRRATQQREQATAQVARARFERRSTRLTAQAARRASRREDRLARSGERPWGR